jgi:hypothetical protein
MAFKPRALSLTLWTVEWGGSSGRQPVDDGVFVLLVVSRLRLPGVACKHIGKATLFSA